MATWWTPDNAKLTGGLPEVGSLIALSHAVWRVIGVRDEPALSDEDRDTWIRKGMPDLDTWEYRPRIVGLRLVGGALPDWVTAADTDGRAIAHVSVDQMIRSSWCVYPSGRWPMCSCCGEPTPCRAELDDRAVAAAIAEMDRLTAKQPGHCWACDEPIGPRQRVVAYPGVNVDYPPGPDAVFHLRGKCYGAAADYELRWIAADPAHRRILTRPECDGLLVVHHDGSSECAEPGCAGHDSHEHSSVISCYLIDGGCRRGCSRSGHPGARPAPRPAPSGW